MWVIWSSHPEAHNNPIHSSERRQHAKYSLEMGRVFKSFHSSFSASGIPMFSRTFFMSLMSTFSPLRKWELFQDKR
ncbi:rCG33164 [Rattus norvegicus]|uniref:RCG33164 n=1 Tax=Rattus norvegicus TaxID=10116 RepID=A6HJX1_RAT|nr:rCG33164 [Rattus norvegicus]